MFIKFIKRFDVYKPGDAANLSVGFAESLVEKGRAKKTKPPKKKTKPPKK